MAITKYLQVDSPISGAETLLLYFEDVFGRLIVAPTALRVSKSRHCGFPFTPRVEFARGTTHDASTAPVRVVKVGERAMLVLVGVWGGELGWVG